MVRSAQVPMPRAQLLLIITVLILLTMTTGDGFSSGKLANKALNLLVIRTDSLGNLVNARPCIECLKLMQVVGINKIYYSDNGSIIECKASTMISLQISTPALFAKNSTKKKNHFLLQCVKLLPDVIHADNIEHLLDYNFTKETSTLLTFRCPSGHIIKRITIVGAD